MGLVVHAHLSNEAKGKTRGFFMGQGKGNLGGKFSLWGHRLDLEAKATPLADPLDLFKGEGRAGVFSP
jgi:hypothetical protein